MAKVIKITQQVATDSVKKLVATNCSPYGNEGDIIKVNDEGALIMISKGFAKLI